MRRYRLDKHTASAYIIAMKGLKQTWTNMRSVLAPDRFADLCRVLGAISMSRGLSTEERSERREIGRVSRPA